MTRFFPLPSVFAKRQPRSGRHGAARWWLIAAVCAAWIGGRHEAHAQLRVDLAFNRHAYILYEPIIATVEVTNFAGRDLVLDDSSGKPWLNLEVTNLDGSIIAPYDPDFKLRSITVPAGKTVKSQVDLTPLFPIRDLGEHRVRADVYFAEADRYAYSNYVTFDLTSGKTIWRQMVGVPGDKGDLREISLLTHQTTDRLLLYVRVRSAEGDTIYVTRQIGRLVVTGREPEELLDRNNSLHVLQEAVPGAYLYTVINVDGERLTQQAYNRVGASRPTLVRSESGIVEVRGGQVQVAPALVVDGPGGAAPVRQPRLSDRPPLPQSAANPGH